MSRDRETGGIEAAAAGATPARRSGRTQAGKATLPEDLDADGVGRYPQRTGAALYFSTLEVLQNVQKYAEASSATVLLREDGGRLLVGVADDGRGSDMTAIKRVLG